MRHALVQKSLRRILKANSLQELFQGTAAERATTFALLAECASTGSGRLGSAAAGACRRAGVSERYLIDRVMVLVGSILENRRQDLYRTLGVDPGATQQEIRLRWRQLVKDLHPDHGGNRETFLMAKRAYDILVDPAKRIRYERFWLQQIAPIERAALLAQQGYRPSRWAHVASLRWIAHAMARGRYAIATGVRRRVEAVARAGRAVVRAGRAVAASVVAVVAATIAATRSVITLAGATIAGAGSMIAGGRGLRRTDSARDPGLLGTESTAARRRADLRASDLRWSELDAADHHRIDLHAADHHRTALHAAAQHAGAHHGSALHAAAQHGAAHYGPELRASQPKLHPSAGSPGSRAAEHHQEPPNRAAPAKEAKARSGDSVSIAEAQAFLERYRRSFESMSAEGIARLFAKAAVENGHTGRAAIAQAYFARFQNFRSVTYQLGNADIRPDGSRVSATAAFRIAFVDARGKNMEMQGWARWWLARRDREIQILRLEDRVDGGSVA